MFKGLSFRSISFNFSERNWLRHLFYAEFRLYTYLIGTPMLLCPLLTIKYNLMNFSSLELIRFYNYFSEFSENERNCIYYLYSMNK